MVLIDRGVKFWVFLSVVSLLIWVLYWLRPSLEYFLNLGQSITQSYIDALGVVYWSGLLGYFARLVAVILGLIAIVLVWGKRKSFASIKRFVSGALLLEAIYFLSLLPTVWFMLRPGRITFSIPLSVSFLLQIIFVVPFLTLLAFNIRNYDDHNKLKMKYVAAAIVGYFAALYVNALFRWFDMILVEGLVFLFSGIRGVGFLNVIVFMSLGLIFAIVSANYMIKHEIGSALRWLGLSLMMIGLHYIIFLFYSYFVGALNFIWLVDVWTFPLFGLGISLLLANKKCD